MSTKEKECVGARERERQRKLNRSLTAFPNFANPLKLD